MSIKLSSHIMKAQTIDAVWLLKEGNMDEKQHRTDEQHRMFYERNYFNRFGAINIKFMTQIMKWDKNVYRETDRRWVTSMAHKLHVTLTILNAIKPHGLSVPCSIEETFRKSQ